MEVRYRRLLLCILIALLSAGSIAAQEQRGAPTQPIILRAADYEAGTHVPSVAAAFKRTFSPAADIQVTYNGFSREAERAFEYAVEIWETLLSSPIPIRVNAQWVPLEEDVLGSAGPQLLANYLGAPQLDTWYPMAIAEAITGREYDPQEPDIFASFNSDFDDWYFGLDGRPPPGTYDFVTVVLHELAHGLGFTGSMSVDDGDDSEYDECPTAGADYGCWGFGEQGYPAVFDRFTEDGAERSLLNTSVYPNPSLALGAVLQSDDVFFAGSTTAAANLDVPVSLYAPDNFEPGSSYSHLDEEVFPAGDLNSLMTPRLALSEAIHSPGPLTCAIMQDIGWTLASACLELLSLGLVSFEASSRGDHVRLSWMALNAPSTAQFEVQRRYFNDPFTTVDVVEEPVLRGQPNEFAYRGRGLDPGRYTYRIKQVMNDGRVFFSAEVTVFIEITNDFFLTEAYPNPFLNEAHLSLVVDEAQQVVAEVFDIRGRRVAWLFSGTVRERERLMLTLRGHDLPGGLYIIRVRGNGFMETRTVVHTG